MPRPEAALLDPARYPFTTRTTTRFADVDPNRHLNNVALAAMMEDARVRFNVGLGLREAIHPNRPMVASFGIEYLAQGYFPDPIDVHVAVADTGRSSVTMVQLLTQNGRAVAFARSVIVCTDGERSAPLPDGFAAQAIASWGLRG